MNRPKKLIKKVQPKAVSLFAKGKKSLKTKSGFVQFTLNQYITSPYSKLPPLKSTFSIGGIFE
jgi:hypothetical protein